MQGPAERAAPSRRSLDGSRQTSPVTAVERLHQFIERGLQLQLFSVVLGHFQAEFRRIARGSTALAELLGFRSIRRFCAGERAFARVAPRLLRVLSSIGHRAADREYGRTEQGKDDECGTDSIRDAQRTAPLLTLSAARLSRRCLVGASDDINGQNETVSLARGQVIERNAETTVEVPGDHAGDLELQIATG